MYVYVKKSNQVMVSMYFNSALFMIFTNSDDEKWNNFLRNKVLMHTKIIQIKKGNG